MIKKTLGTYDIRWLNEVIKLPLCSFSINKFFRNKKKGHANRCPRALVKHTKKGIYYHKRKLC